MKKSTAVAPSTLKPAPVKPAVKSAPTVTTDKAKVLGFINITLFNDAGEVIDRTSNGIRLTESQWLTKFDRNLLAVAKANGGRAKIRNAVLDVVLMSEEDKPLDVSKYALV